MTAPKKPRTAFKKIGHTCYQQYLPDELFMRLGEAKQETHISKQMLVSMAVERMLDFVEGEGTPQQFHKPPVNRQLPALQALSENHNISVPDLIAIAVDRLVMYINGGGTIDRWKQP